MKFSCCYDVDVVNKKTAKQYGYFNIGLFAPKLGNYFHSLKLLVWATFVLDLRL